MKGALASPVAAATAMQESFGCAVANRFHQLLDDESDPFDILREAERRKQQSRRRDEVAAAAASAAGRKSGPSGVAAASSSAKRESQKERKCSPFLPPPESPPAPGQKRAPKRGEQQGWNDSRGTEVKQDKAEWRPSFREIRPHEVDRQAEFALERPIDRFDRERPMRGRGGGRGGMRGRGRGGMNRTFGGFDQRGKREFDRQSGSDKTGIRAEDKRGGNGARNWGVAKDDLSELEQAAPMEETAEIEENPGVPEGESPTKVAEGEPVEEVVQEMTLDEWKNLQEQNRPKPEFNIRKPETTVPSKAVVIHKSKYRDDVLKEDFEDDYHCFRKAANDITSQLDINFGNLPRPGRGARGGRGGRGRVRRVEDSGPRPEVMMHISAPNPDDPEDFPALA